MRRGHYVLLAEGQFGLLTSKTANGMLRYRPDEVVAVVDSSQVGKTALDVLGFGGDVPVVAALADALSFKPDHLVIGIAPPGGKLPDEWKQTIAEALSSGLSIISGLHTFLSDDPELAALASAHHVSICDLRRPPEELKIASGLWKERTATTILTVGSDADIGKMTTAYHVYLELRRRGLRVDFIGTGQTGILLSGKGVAVDAVPSDFVAGAIEEQITLSARDHDIILVEGQGSLYHQGFSCVTLGLLHGTMPDVMILCHQPSRVTNDYGWPLPSLTEMVTLHETVLRPFRQSLVLAVSLMTADMSETEAREALDAAAKETGLPADDPVRFGPAFLADAIMESHNK